MTGMTLDRTVSGPLPQGEPPHSEPTTFRRPNPGGRKPTAQAAAAGGYSGSPDRELVETWSALRLDRLNPLVACAVPLLTLAPQLRHQAACDDVDALRLRVIRGIDRFERRVAPLGLSPRLVRAAKYALCATLDDLVLNTPWGSRSIWTTRSLVGTFFSETWGGDRFFDLVMQVRKDPGVNIDLIELLYCCISLGFEGKYRVMPRGASQLLLLREDLSGLIRVTRGDFEREISPHWRGAQVVHQGLDTQVPHWVVGVAALGALVAIYAGLLLAINGASDAAAMALANLPPRGAISLARIAPPPPPARPVAADQVNRLRGALEPDLRTGQVALLDDAQTITLRIGGAALFLPGSADVRPDIAALLGRIGAALDGQPGAVVVAGHTDSQAIHTLRFPSNYDLSRARARAVAVALGAAMHDRSRLVTEGRADTQPVAPDTTEAGRQQNRRVDLIITKSS
jgi:type VI secretion system protein ImpK